MEFSRNIFRGGSLEEVPICRRPDHGHFKAGGSWYGGAGSVPRARRQLSHLLQMAQPLWWYGRQHDVRAKGPAGRESALEEDVCRRPAWRRPSEGSPRKKMVRPSQRREMAQSFVSAGRISIRHACSTFDISETCYRYQAKRSAENEQIADYLGRLTYNQRNWGGNPSTSHFS